MVSDVKLQKPLFAEAMQHKDIVQGRLNLIKRTYLLVFSKNQN